MSIQQINDVELWQIPICGASEVWSKLSRVQHVAIYIDRFDCVQLQDQMVSTAHALYAAEMIVSPAI